MRPQVVEKTEQPALSESPGGSAIGSKCPWSTAFPVMLMLLAGLLVYGNTFSVPFVFSDEAAIVENRSIRSLWPLTQVFHPPSLGAAVQGRPLLNLTFALNYAVGGLHVRGYHIANLAIHLLASLVLFGLVRQTLRGTKRDVTTTPSPGWQIAPPSALPDRLLAFFIALLWLLHPLNTQAVTFVTQRAESLSALLYLFTLYALARSAGVSNPERQVDHDAGTNPHHRHAWSTAAILSCAIGAGVKETMVTAPLVGLLFDRAYLAGSWRAVFRYRRWLHAGLFASWGIIAYLIVQPGEARGPHTGFGSAVSPLYYLATQAEVLLRYFRLAVWPDTLCFDYRWPIIPTLRHALPEAIAVGCLLFVTLATWRRSPRWGFLFIWIFLTMAPTSSIMPLSEVAAERRMYLPLAAIVSLAVLGLWALGTSVWRYRRPSHGNRERQDIRLVAHALRPAFSAWLWFTANVTALTLVALLLGIRTWARNADFSTAFGLWQDTLDKCPGNARAWFNRGFLHDQGGRSHAAMRDYNQALALDPGYPGPYYSRGNLHFAFRQYDSAIEDYTHALELAPALITPWANRGLAFAALNRHEEAIADFTTCLAAAPTLANVHYHRGNSLAALERYPAAIADYDRAINLNPNFADAFHNRAAAHAMLGHLNQATADLGICQQLGGTPSPELIQMLNQDAKLRAIPEGPPP